MRFAHRLSSFTTSLALLGITACGGEQAQSPVSSTPAKLASTDVVIAKPAHSTSSAVTPAIADDVKPADPDESPVAIRLTPLFTKEKLPHFPKATVSDRDCWQDLELSGDANKDYAALVARCGKPTGVAEYASPARGHLHHKHDQRDSFKLELARGFCYRYFAVADEGIDDLDILVERYGGDLVGDDDTRGQVAIIQSDKPWCMDDDVDYDFEVAVNGKGQGNYLIGVWARPKGTI
ncbi:MAG TPA: hypothetical protein VHU80_15295 [Polyangiaceae bacterium]|jgi:hypothetical protein|nr:hypothetical protein [Polyangiaceae bacterium]